MNDECQPDLFSALGELHVSANGAPGVAVRVEPAQGDLFGADVPRQPVMRDLLAPAPPEPGISRVCPSRSPRSVPHSPTAQLVRRNDAFCRFVDFLRPDWDRVRDLCR